MLIEPNVARLTEELGARQQNAQRRRIDGDESDSYVQEVQSHV